RLPSVSSAKPLNLESFLWTEEPLDSILQLSSYQGWCVDGDGISTGVCSILFYCPALTSIKLFLTHCPRLPTVSQGQGRTSPLSSLLSRTTIPGWRSIRSTVSG